MTKEKFNLKNEDEKQIDEAIAELARIADKVMNLNVLSTIKGGLTKEEKEELESSSKLLEEQKKKISDLGFLNTEIIERYEKYRKEATQ